MIMRWYSVIGFMSYKMTRPSRAPTHPTYWIFDKNIAKKTAFYHFLCMKSHTWKMYKKSVKRYVKNIYFHCSYYVFQTKIVKNQTFFWLFSLTNSDHLLTKFGLFSDFFQTWSEKEDFFRTLKSGFCQKNQTIVRAVYMVLQIMTQ